jgi:hypothetical protein
MNRQRGSGRAPEAWAYVTEWAEAPSCAPTPEARPSPLAEPVFVCASCEAEIRGRATFHVGLAFCCAGCVAGGPCTCSYDAEPDTPVERADPRARAPERPRRELAVRRIA